MARRVRLKVSGRLLRKKARRSLFSTTKHCRFCASDTHEALLDYKNSGLLRSFITERGKIIPSRVSGTCTLHQRILSDEVKKARVMALLPFTAVN